MMEPWTTRTVRWMLAFGVVTGAHGAVIAAALHKPQVVVEEYETGGVFLVDLVAITSSPTEEREDVAVGRQSEERAAVMASAPQQQTTEQLPEPVPETPHAPEIPEPPPDDALAAIKPDLKNKEESKTEPTPAVEANQAPAIAPVEASEATTPPKIENAKEKADVPQGQNAGLSAKDQRALENWRRDLVVHLSRHKRYPSAARNRRLYGTVEVAFEIDRDGKVTLSKLQSSSGSQLLDEAALTMIVRANPMPAPPESVPGERIAFVLPVQFKLKD